jgi:hypothetical protein
MEVLKNCRICKSNDLTDVISLGEQIITSRFPLYGDFSTPKTPIDLCLCAECGLLQLRQTTFASELYEHEYGYRSGISNTMREHLRDYQAEIIEKVVLKEGDMVMDIGSNDSTMLQYYSKNIRRVGVDPTGTQFKKYYGNVALIATYFTLENFRKIYPSATCKIVSSVSMFYDLPDPVQFARDIYEILEDDGIWTCEQSYMPKMIETNSIDTICHEHLEYYGLRQVKEIADRSNFKITDVKFNNCNGGSFRVYFSKTGPENSTLVKSILEKEKNIDYKKFMDSCNIEITRLKSFADSLKSENKTMYVYGASTKGNCLLQFAGLGPDIMKYAVERNQNKVGKMTSTGIEIISEEDMRANPPDYLLVLPWHFRSEIIEREALFLNSGGHLVFPLPNFEIV